MQLIANTDQHKKNPMPQEEKAPPLHLHNPSTGVRIWPVMKQDSEGNWVVSSPEFVDNMMAPPKEKSGKNQSSALI
jgi:hypothetical protein